MKFFYYFYILIIVLTQIIWLVLSLEGFEDTELKYLSNKLNPVECLRLLEAMYLKKPMTDEEYAQSESKIPFNDESLLRRQLERPFLSHDNCRVKLEGWVHNLPEKSNTWARVAIESVLRNLGRPDLAQYVKRNGKIVEYFDGISRNSRNAAKHPTVSRSVISKTIQVTPAGRKFKEPPKEAVVQVYRTPEESKATRGKSILENRGEFKGAHGVGSQRIEDDDSRTRWTAFLILLGLIALTVVATVFFALYKKNRGKLFTSSKKTCDDRCPLADRFTRQPSTTDVDIEQGTSTSCSPCGRRKKRESFTREPSRSPSSICIREKSIPARKPKRKKYIREKQSRLEKRRRRGCDKNCAGIIKNEVAVLPKIDKSTKPEERKMSEKSQNADLPKPRIDLKKFHEKIANILRKDDPSCNCCKCSAFSGEEKCQGIKNFTNKKNICTDNQCQKFKLKSIAELCLSPDEKSPKKNGKDDLNRKKKEKKRKKKEKSREKDTDRDKESEKTSPENSARSKEKKESKIKEKKMKKGKCNMEEVCGRKTCHFRRSTVDKPMNVDNNL